jgi:hypothetical protein
MRGAKFIVLSKSKFPRNFHSVCYQNERSSAKKKNSDIYWRYLVKFFSDGIYNFFNFVQELLFIKSKNWKKEISCLLRTKHSLIG